MTTYTVHPDVASMAFGAAVMASKDRVFPELASVRLVIDKGEIMAMATDRYSLGVFGGKAEGAERLDVLIPATDALRLAKAFHKLKGVSAVTLTREDDQEWLTVAYGTSSERILTVMADFPRCARLIASPSGERTDHAAINPAFLAKLVEWHKIGAVKGDQPGARYECWSHRGSTMVRAMWQLKHGRMAALFMGTNGTTPDTEAEADLFVKGITAIS